MDRDDTPLLDDEESQSDTESSLSDLAFDNFASALVGSTTAPASPPDREPADAGQPDDAVRLTLPVNGGRQFERDADGASASALWHGRPVFTTMVCLMMLSSAQLVIGFLFAFVYVGILPLATAVLGLLVSSGHMMEFIPGDHLEKQIKLVRVVCSVALCANAASLGLYSVTLLVMLVSLDGWSVDLIIIMIYLLFWAQTLVFVRVGFVAHNALRMLHPEMT